MDSMLTGGSALMESIQAQLKQKEGEVVQLQMEVSGLERVRERMTAELAKTAEAANMAKDLGEQLNALRSQYVETEQKYQTMLTVSWRVTTFCRIVWASKYILLRLFRCTEKKSRKLKSSV